MSNEPDPNINWVNQIDPSEVVKILTSVMFAKTPKNLEALVEAWSDTSWYVWEYDSSLGCKYILCRTVGKDTAKGPDVPKLFTYVQSCNDHTNERRAVAQQANKDFRNLLIAAGVKK